MRAVWIDRVEWDESHVLITCFPKEILSPSDRRMSAEAPLNLEMALLRPANLFFISPVLVMWSAWQWVFTARKITFL